MKTSAALFGLLMLVATTASAGVAPEDILKGRVIVSDRNLPTKWTSAGAYASQLKGLNKSSLYYDKQSGKLTIFYAAFFAQPVDDVQVDVVLYDLSAGNGQRMKKGSGKASLERKGVRQLFSTRDLTETEIPEGKMYLFAIESKGKIIASTEVMIRRPK